MRTENAPVIRLEDYRPTDYLIDAVDLNIRLDPQTTRVRARLSLRPRAGTAAGTPLALDGDGLDLTSIALDREIPSAAEFTATPDKLVLHSPPAGAFQLEIVTELNPSANTALMGLYLSNGIYTTQCEAEGFRRITYFLDRPDVLSVYTTRIEARRAEAPVLLGNGNPVETGDVPGTDRHYAIWRDPFPKSSYLFAIVGGDLAHIHDTFRTGSGRSVSLGIHCEAGNEDRCRYALDALKRSMRWDEERFGREYDLDVFNIVAVSDFNMGAMENKGLNIFNDKYVLVDPHTGTDGDYAGVEAVIAHEYFHNWTGNRITCRDWFQLCLKEGLTVFRDQEFSSDERSRPVKRIADVAALRQHQFPEDAGPLAHPPRPTSYREINNFYTATVYEKGAEICRMLQIVLGPAGFRAGMDLYFERHDGDAATIEDFLACFADATGADLAQFALWYTQAGTPTVTVAHAYDAASQRLTLRLRQDLPETPDRQPKKPLHIPIAFGLVGSDGNDMPFAASHGAVVADGVIHLTSSNAEVAFDGVASKPVPSLFRSFSAPVIVQSDLSVADRLFLIGRDPDPFNRWEAIQQVALGILTANVAALRDGAPARDEPGFAEALGRLADDDGLDPAFRALALSLPGETDVAQAIGADIDPDAIHDARRALLKSLGRALGSIVERAAARNPPASAYSPDADQAGRRAFAHAAWMYSVAGGGLSPDGMASRFDAAANLTDRLAALRLMTHFELEGADVSLETFHQDYRDVPLVLDKWLALQATTPSHAALDRVRALTRHPAFSLKTPNRVYALIRSFAAANPVGFNRPDGAGYAFLREIIAELDPQNPSVASRLATAFRSFRMLEPGRRRLAETALTEIADLPGLSRDVNDIVTRTLAG